MVLCRYWLAGNCRFGNSCWYDHFKITDSSNLLQNKLLEKEQMNDSDDSEEEDSEEEEEKVEDWYSESDSDEEEEDDSNDEDFKYVRKISRPPCRKKRKFNSKPVEIINTELAPLIIICHPNYHFTKWLNTIVLQNIFMYLQNSDQLAFRLVYAAFSNELYIGYNSHLEYRKYPFQLFLLFKDLIQSYLDLKSTTECTALQFINGCILHLNARILNHQLVSNDSTHSLDMNDYLTSNDENLKLLNNYKQLFKNGCVKFTSWASVKLDHSQGSVCEVSIKRRDGNGFVKLFQHSLKTIHTRDDKCYGYYYLATRKEKRMETLLLSDTYDADRVIHDNKAMKDVFSLLDIPPNWNLNDFVTFLMICSCSFKMQIHDYNEKEYEIVDILQFLQFHDMNFNLLSNNNYIGERGRDIPRNSHSGFELDGIEQMADLVNEISQSTDFNYLNSLIELRNLCLKYSGKFITFKNSDLEDHIKSKAERYLETKQVIDDRKGFSVSVSSQVLNETKTYSECNFKTANNEILNVILDVKSFKGYHCKSTSFKIIKNKCEKIEWIGK